MSFVSVKKFRDFKERFIKICNLFLKINDGRDVMEELAEFITQKIKLKSITYSTSLLY
jgi:hypothetical protein